MVEPQPPGEVRPCLAILQPARRVRDCRRIATASLCAGVSVAGYAARTRPSMRGLGLGAGVGEQELGCVGDLGHGDESDQRG
jgi:hypothetical protein